MYGVRSQSYCVIVELPPVIITISSCNKLERKQTPQVNMKNESPYGKKRKKKRANVINVINAAGQPPFTSKVSLVFCHFKKKCQVHGPSDKICMLLARVKVQALSLFLSLSHRP